MADLARQSVYDRLVGADLIRAGGRPPRLPVNIDESAALLKANLLRDVEELLNARQVSDAGELGYERLESSIYTFGIRDVTTFSADRSSTPAELGEAIKTAIERFEPRLHNVAVEPAGTGNRWERLVRFHISADLQMEPEDEHISFDTVLRVSTKRFEVGDESNE